MSDEKSFADLLEKSFEVSDNLAPGQKIKAEVVRIGKEWVFIDLGTKSEGVLSIHEFQDNDGNLTIKEGDTIEAYFLATKQNERIFTTKVGRGAGQAHLEEAFHSGIPVEGRVEKEIKGGYEVKIAGTARAFCPYSQMSLRRVENPEEFIGQNFSFIISEYSNNGRNILVSRRTFLKEENAKKKEALKETLQEGMTVSGNITTIRDFGAFVDIGGLEGLIPASEIAWGHVEDIHERLHEGQKVEVVVMKLDWDKDRFSFSLKQALPDPWEMAAAKYQEGSFHSGTVVRLVDFGAFVNLEPGIDGLVHISKLGAGRRIKHPREVVGIGDTLEVRIDGVDQENKRISLSLPGPSKESTPVAAGKAAEEEEREEFQRYKEKTKTKASGSLGTLGDILKEKLKKEGK